jgi:hypothetical protein
MLNCSEADKKKLRKIKLASPVTDAARNTLVQGIAKPGLSGAYIQFGRDVQVYGLWEALLYAHGYEESGEFKAGSAQKALNAALAELNKTEEIS